MMGDATIHLLLDSALAAGAAAADGATATSSPAERSFHFRSLSHVLPGDASLAELMDFISSQIDASSKAAGEGVSIEKLTVLDVSYHPAKSISHDVRRYTERSGPNSKTLQGMGWYPSGKLVVLPAPSSSSAGGEEELLERFLEWQGRNLAQHEEFAYNNPDAANEGRTFANIDGMAAATGGVQWTGVGSSQGALLKPSEIFTAVEQRSDGMEVEAPTKPKPKKKPRRTEKERTQRLDALLEKVETTSGKKKKKAVSEKVRTMLLKSRSEGNKKLRMEDRFHLEVVTVWDVGDASSNAEGGTSYRFFSRQSTAGRVASAVAPNLGQERAAELLVRHPPTAEGAPQEGAKRYRRLPNIMSLHDAQTAGWVKEFDVVVVRIYALHGRDEDGAEYGPSKSVNEPESDDENMDGNDAQNDVDEGSCGRAEAPSAMEVDGRTSSQPAESTQDEEQQHLQRRIHAIIQTIDESNAKKKKKPVSQQVRNMLMKSKSTGNKRVKQEDRIYLEVITFHDNGSADVDPSSHSTSYRFFTKQNDVRHMISTCCDDGNAKAELIVRRSVEDTSLGFAYQRLPADMTLGDAIQKGHIDNFGRVMIRILDSDNCLPWMMWREADNTWTII